jgi:hypothetical protein
VDHHRPQIPAGICFQRFFIGVQELLTGGIAVAVGQDLPLLLQRGAAMVKDFLKISHSCNSWMTKQIETHN